MVFTEFQIHESPIRLRIEAQLVEMVVRQHVENARRNGQFQRFDMVHERLDPVYELPERDREAEFARHHADFFVDFGFETALSDVIGEFPEFREQIAEVVVAHARSRRDESVDLSQQSDEDSGVGAADDARSIGARVDAKRFRDVPGVQRHLRHELTHLADMLDPTFSFDTDHDWGRLPPVEENLLRDRYRTLWCASIDGRTEHVGREPDRPSEHHRAELDRLFRTMPEDVQQHVFERLWGPDPIRHRDLVEMAGNRDAFRRFAEVGACDDSSLMGTIDVVADVAPSPGDPCPLCRFPTFEWIVPTVEDASISDHIRHQFPDWRPEYGVCGRCHEHYELELMSTPGVQKGVT